MHFSFANLTDCHEIWTLMLMIKCNCLSVVCKKPIVTCFCLFSLSLDSAYLKCKCDVHSLVLSHVE